MSTVAKRKLGRQQQRLLERLREGPAINGELARIALRYSARLFELKKFGYEFEVKLVNRDAGIFRYTLVKEPQA